LWKRGCCGTRCCATINNNTSTTAATTATTTTTAAAAAHPNKTTTVVLYLYCHDRGPRPLAQGTEALHPAVQARQRQREFVAALSRVALQLPQVRRSLIMSLIRMRIRASGGASCSRRRCR
jgi:hypothetical protein